MPFAARKVELSDPDTPCSGDPSTQLVRKDEHNTASNPSAQVQTPTSTSRRLRALKKVMAFMSTARVVSPARLVAWHLQCRPTLALAFASKAHQPRLPWQSPGSTGLGPSV